MFVFIGNWRVYRTILSEFESCSVLMWHLSRRLTSTVMSFYFAAWSVLIGSFDVAIVIHGTIKLKDGSWGISSAFFQSFIRSLLSIMHSDLVCNDLFAFLLIKCSGVCTWLSASNKTKWIAKIFSCISVYTSSLKSALHEFWEASNLYTLLMKLIEELSIDC